MSLKSRTRPQRLGAKLLTIRTALGLSQNGMIARLGEDLTQNRISDYELGKVEPPLGVILSYARAAGVCVEVLIDDVLDLPHALPAKKKHKP